MPVSQRATAWNLRRNLLVLIASDVCTPLIEPVRVVVRASKAGRTDD